MTVLDAFGLCTQRKTLDPLWIKRFFFGGADLTRINPSVTKCNKNKSACPWFLDEEVTE